VCSCGGLAIDAHVFASCVTRVSRCAKRATNSIRTVPGVMRFSVHERGYVPPSVEHGHEHGEGAQRPVSLSATQTISAYEVFSAHGHPCPHGMDTTDGTLLWLGTLRDIQG